MLTSMLWRNQMILKMKKPFKLEVVHKTMQVIITEQGI